MPGVSRDNDTAGGDLIPSQTTVKANDELIIVDGDGVAGHGIAPHPQLYPRFAEHCKNWWC